MTGADLVLLGLLLALAGNLYVSVRTLSHTRQLSAQVAVLTLRVMETDEALVELDIDLRAALDREP